MFKFTQCFLLFLLIISGVISVSCTLCNDGYKQYRLEKGIAHFSFEYPCDWKIGINEIEQDYTDIMIFAPSFKSKRNDVNVISTDWSIFITYPDQDKPDIKTAMNDTLSFWQDTFDAKIIESSEINIKDVTAEQFIISYKSAIDDPWQEPEPIIHKEMFFNYNGLIWNMTEIYNEDYENLDNHQRYWEHMLETWQFLD
jgi:hypothetical protein